MLSNHCSQFENLYLPFKAAYKKMDATKEKFRKAFDDQEKATAAYNKANDDGNVTRNEVLFKFLVM